MRAILAAVLANLVAAHELRDNDSVNSNQEVCLLSLRANMSRAAASLFQSGQAVAKTHRKMREWAQDHENIKSELLHARAASGTEADMSAVTDDNEIDSFIEEQRRSTDTCFAKLLEARRTLDGVTEKVLRLDEEISAQTEISKGNMMIIQDRFTASEEALKEKEDTGKDCEEQFEKAIEDLQHYRDELAELKQIANPEVRSKVASDLDYEQLIEQHIASVGAQFDQQNSFLQMDASVQTNATMCQGMVNFLNRRSEEKESNATKYTALDCDAMREVLQEEFTKSWEEITRLLQEGENLAQQQKELCYDEAKEVHNTKHASITQDIKDSTRSIQMAKDVISALQPLLDNARLEAEALAAHIQGLKSDCNVDTAVSDHLKTVRRLIQSLNECPGRNDFRLTVPEIV
jgi:hypothetical protein